MRIRHLYEDFLGTLSEEQKEGCRGCMYNIIKPFNVRKRHAKTRRKRL